MCSFDCRLSKSMQMQNYAKISYVCSFLNRSTPLFLSKKTRENGEKEIETSLKQRIEQKKREKTTHHHKTHHKHHKNITKSQVQPQKKSDVLFPGKTPSPSHPSPLPSRDSPFNSPLASRTAPGEVRRIDARNFSKISRIFKRNLSEER